jgi:hypothetical protein
MSGSGAMDLHTVAWATLWFLVVVSFTAGVGIIATAASAGQMPPPSSGIQAVVGELPDGPSSAPSAQTGQAG